MAKLIFLGTAASIPSKNRDNTSFLFLHKKEMFLIDCPGAIHQKLLKAGINFKDIKNIVITHQHPDHFYGIIGLIHAQGYLSKKLTIFSNQNTISLLKELIRRIGLNRSPFPKVSFHDVFKKEFFYNSPSLKLTAIKNKHIRNSFGVKFIFDGKILLYSSDTALSKTILKEAKEAQYLIHDCTASSSYFKEYPQLYKMHTDAKTLASILQNIPLKKIVPIHFLLLKKGELRKIKKELTPLGKKIYFPSDFDILTLS
ncbi:MAG: ribonuclease Z [Candidatus Omnitrophica bacterium]|nr:ribonuclease Z [Candidatus Omnitrophota bacterium]